MMEIRQMFALLLALVLIGSTIPAALAESGSGSSGDDDSDDDSNSSDDDGTADQGSGDAAIDASLGVGLGADDNGGLRGRDRERLQERVDVRKDGREVRIEARARGMGPGGERFENRTEVRERIKADRVELRERIRERIGEIRQNMQERRERIGELRQEFREQKESFKEARDQLKKECGGSPRELASDDCKRAREDLAGTGKEFMGNAAEQLDKMIADLKERIQANDHISDDVAADMIAKLDESAAAVATAQAAIDAINGTDVNATKTAAEELRTAFSEARVTIRLAHGLLWMANDGRVIDHLETIQARVDEARDALDANGTDVTELDAAIAAFDAKVEVASQAYEDGMTAYVDGIGDVTTNDEASVLIRGAKDSMQDVRDDVRDAREDLRVIVRLIRELDPVTFAGFASVVRADAAAAAAVQVESSDDDGTPDQGTGDVNGTTETEINTSVSG